MTETTGQTLPVKQYRLDTSGWQNSSDTIGSRYTTTRLYRAISKIPLPYVINDHVVNFFLPTTQSHSHPLTLYSRGST